MKKNSKPLVSVIVPVYNVEEYIYKCAISLINQTYQNLELIFIDDGAKDRSVKVLNGIKDKRIKVIRQKNSGVSVARNAGLDIARGEYVVFLDGDDFVAEDYVEYLFELIYNNNGDFAYSTELFKSKNDLQSKEEKIEVINGEKSSGILLSPDVVVGSCNKIYRRKVIEKNKLRFRSDLYYGEGLNFIIRMSILSKRVIVGNRKVLFYRKNNISSATTKFNIDKYHNGIKSLGIVGELINQKNKYVKSMYRLHLSNYYLGAITQIIENNVVKEYYTEYRKWKDALRANTIIILADKNVSIYRKCLILAGAISPHLVAVIDKRRRKRIIRNSVV